MGFLDNIENDLKNLERADERGTRAERGRRDEERARARAVAPAAEALRNGTFADEFLTHAVRIGHATRTRVGPTWIGGTLRVDAREKRVEFRPTEEGVLAVWWEGGVEVGRELVDLMGSAEALARRWLAA